MAMTHVTLWAYHLLGLLCVCIVLLEAYPQPVSEIRQTPEYTDNENIDEIYNFIKFYKNMLDLQEAHRNNDFEGVNLDHTVLKRGNSRPVGSLGLLELLRLEMEEENTRETVENQRQAMEGAGR